MKKSLFQKVMCFILSVATLFSVAVMTVSAASLTSEEEHSGRLKDRDGYSSAAATLEEMQAVVGTTSYEEYAAANADKTKGPEPIPLSNATAWDENLGKDTNGNAKPFNVGAFVGLTGDKAVYESTPDTWPGFVDENHQNPFEDALYLSDESKVTWSVTIPENASGLYWIEITYYTCYTKDSKRACYRD